MNPIEILSHVMQHVQQKGEHSVFSVQHDLATKGLLFSQWQIAACLMLLSGVGEFDPTRLPSIGFVMTGGFLTWSCDGLKFACNPPKWRCIE